MVYEIGGKYYIMANRKFYEVKITKNAKNEYDVKILEKIKPIEVKQGQIYNQVSLEAAYKKHIID